MGRGPLLWSGNGVSECWILVRGYFLNFYVWNVLLLD